METIITTTDATIMDTGLSHSNPSAVAWSAIIAGTFTAIAITLILFLLGSALGLAAVSPWSYEGISAATFTVTAVIWLIVMQWVSSALGGYLTGRLRSKWVDMDRDEVFFRDTAHGFLSWALATVVTVFFLASAASAIFGGGVSAVTSVASSAAAGAGIAAAENADDAADGSGPDMYLIDILFRRDSAAQANATPAAQPVAPPAMTPSEPAAPSDAADAETETMGAPEMPAVINPPVSMSVAANMTRPAMDARVRAEAGRILFRKTTDGAITADDKAYLIRIVADESEISEQDATTRVNTVLAQIEEAKTAAKQTADEARKVSASFSIYAFLSLVIGAFIASASAALGGIHRDEY